MKSYSPRAAALVVVGATALALTVFSPLGAEAATAKVGGKCAKAGAKSAALVCTKKAGRLVWAAAGAAAAGTATTVAGAAAPPATAGIDGVWKATTASSAGYRVKEVLGGQSTTANGRTNGVTGTLTIAGTSATAADLAIDLTTLKSPEARRDSQVQGRILETAKFPKATMKLLSSIDFGSIPADKAQVTSKAKIELTVKAVTKTVEVDLSSRRNGATIEVLGSIPITWADWGITNPSNPPIVTTEDKGTIEFLIVFAR